MVSDQKATVKLADLLPRPEVDLVGVASLDIWKGTKLEETALRLLPQARSVVVFASEVFQEVLDLASPERMTGAASPGDLVARNADYLSGRLTRAAYDIVKASHKLGLKALPLPAAGCPQDSRFLQAVFSYKHAGQAAGLGSFGWHTLLVTPRFGPRVRLAACLTEAVVEVTSGDTTVQCNDCGICLENCPSGALSRPQAGEQYSINKFACFAFRNASGGNCCECMRLCPMGR